MENSGDGGKGVSADHITARTKVDTHRCEAVLGVHEASVRRHTGSRPDGAGEEYREHRKPRVVQLNL